MLIIIFEIIINIILIFVGIAILGYLFPLIYVYYTHYPFEMCIPIWYNYYLFYYIGYATDRQIKSEIGIIKV